MSVPKEKVIAAIAEAREELDHALVELEKMPAFDPGRTAFTAHALHNYLQVAGATIELLEPALAGQTDPLIDSLLGNLKQATSLMRSTAVQLLSSTAPAPHFRHKQVDLVALVGIACDFYRRRAARKQIQVQYEASAPTPEVLSDNVAIGAVLDNLLSNAVKYSPAGSTIRVSVHGEPGRVVCAVRDEGPGLSAADQAQLFRRGVRLSAVPTGGEPSFGYGLAVAKEMIEALGGTIWCDSTLGQGACFAFALPVAAAG
jgi:signal transduction histidine kinase